MHAEPVSTTISLHDEKLWCVVFFFFFAFPPQTTFWLNTALPESQIWKNPTRDTRDPTIPLF